MSYLNRKNLQIIGFTATATPYVRKDIIRQLSLSPSVKQFLSSFNRSNLYFEVKYKDPFTNDAYEEVLELISSYGKGTSGIMYFCFLKYNSYCATRNACNVLAKRLHLDDVNAASYHAGLSTKDRTRILKAWSGSDGENDSIDVVVATISFGVNYINLTIDGN